MRQKLCVVRHVILMAGLMLILNAAAAQAQSEATIRGQVVAAADGSSLPKAAVTLTAVSKGESTQTTADAAGRFVFQQLRPGEYVVSGSADGFAPREVRLVVDPREVKMVTLSLDLRGVEANVQVTGESNPLTSTYSPSFCRLTPAPIVPVVPGNAASIAGAASPA